MCCLCRNIGGCDHSLVLKIPISAKAKRVVHVVESPTPLSPLLPALFPVFLFTSLYLCEQLRVQQSFVHVFVFDVGYGVHVDDIVWRWASPCMPTSQLNLPSYSRPRLPLAGSSDVALEACHCILLLVTDFGRKDLSAAAAQMPQYGCTEHTLGTRVEVGQGFTRLLGFWVL